MKDRRGFAISVVMYSILLLFIVLLASIMGVLATRKTLLDKSKQDVSSYLNAAEDTIQPIENEFSVLYGDNNPLPGEFFNTTSSNIECDIDGGKYTNTKLLDEGIYNVNCTIVYDDIKYASASTKIHVVRDQYYFAYTGDYQELTVYRSGYYKLETWGAEGGSTNQTAYVGGKGGYASGLVYLEENEKLYIYVGGKGNNNCNGTYSAAACLGGYNGGGTAGTTTSVSTGSGGGATHIAKENKLLTEFEFDRSNLLIVAGGGGGASFKTATTQAQSGAPGGGLVGITNDPISASSGYAGGGGGTQFQGGATAHANGTAGIFGQGGSSTANTKQAPGGGGGFYGGGSALYGGAGGGSSYIGGVVSSNTISKTTIAGDSSMPNFAGTGTMIGNIGNGYAKITYIAYDADIGNYEDRTEFTYTGDVQEYVVKETGYYKIQTWGAQGNYYTTAVANAGKGGYASGVVYLTAGTKLYVYVGGGGQKNYEGGYNGGGNSNILTTAGGGGGGATDVRFFGTTIPNDEQLNSNSVLGLRSRIMVAGGGGGAGSTAAGGGGGLTGIKPTGASVNSGNPGNQTSGGAIATNINTKPGLSAGTFGLGGNGGPSTTAGWGGGGGGGYYGGSGGSGSAASTYFPGAGGSSYISGYVGSVAITSATNASPKAGCANGTTDINCSYHYSDLRFTGGITFDGNEVMPSYDGEGEITGNSGNGYAVIEKYNPNIQSYNYLANAQVFTAIKDGYYKLETWGAKGGNASTYVGGNGGYATGVVYLAAGQTVFIHTGGVGDTGCVQTATGNCDGGYNGGGMAGYQGGDGVVSYAGGGGGATHMAIVNDTLANLSDLQNRIYLVAAGGGGASYYNATNAGNGGVGGGLTGGIGTATGTNLPAEGATQVSGTIGKYSTQGIFGQGGSKTTNQAIGGGGAGWYGGGGAYRAGAGGGSSYIGGVISTTTFTKRTVAGNSSMPTYDGLGTMTGNSGNGHAKISYLGETVTRNYQDEEKYYAYTGNSQSFQAPITGYYKLEGWGAQGGGTSQAAYVGGKGGYSKGVIYLQKDQIIYVYVGGQGNSGCQTTYDSKCYGGYNGGGNAGAGAYTVGSGGGATHISKTNYLLTAYENDHTNLLLVAGGGGGGSYYQAGYAQSGGAGGGYSGVTNPNLSNVANRIAGQGGSQFGGGPAPHGNCSDASFGQGGNGAYTNKIATGGGGGFYGGGCSIYAGGGGGSGYVDNMLSTTNIARQSIAGTNAMPTYDNASTKTGNSYNGAAKVTYIGATATLTDSDISYLTSATYAFTGLRNKFTTKIQGCYKIELWGAQGGATDTSGGKGGYTSGKICLPVGTDLYFYVGGKANLFNGGASSGDAYRVGGGATDVRYFYNTVPTTTDLDWDSTLGLRSRIMVAGGGGGNSDATSGSSGGHAGGLSGSSGTAHSVVGPTYVGNGGTQIAGGASSANGGSPGYFGKGGAGANHTDGHAGGGGGGGYYGGSGARWHAGAGGGSSFISGHTGCNAITELGSPSGTTVHYSSKSFTNTSLKSGSEDMPNFNGVGTKNGNTGDGYAKITLMGDVPYTLTIDLGDNVSYTGLLEYMLTTNETVQLESPAKIGSSFTGWSIVSGTGIGSSITDNTFVMGTANATITPTWGPGAITVQTGTAATANTACPYISSEGRSESSNFIVGNLVTANSVGSFVVSGQGIHNMAVIVRAYLICPGGTLTIINEERSPNGYMNITASGSVNSSAYYGQSCYVQAYVWERTANSYECTRGTAYNQVTATISY